uniref:Uncharacterized protein n=1 Tax=Myoviridae sp. ctcwu24 TaxID=2826670 RepID=A0A8S5NHL2_9CAUD|nr:MAG TPA: hypothetical protein [Myoviridae sp. ctcwu24]
MTYEIGCAEEQPGPSRPGDRASREDKFDRRG